FGGRENLRVGLANVIRQYNPGLIGIATTCLSETIGDDVSMFLHEIRNEYGDATLPPLVHVSTPSYCGTHAEGFHAAVRALVDTLAQPGPPTTHVNLMPGMVSPADVRYLKELFDDFGLEPIVLPDYSDTLDGPAWTEYHQIPKGGTPVAAIERMGRARATIEFGGTLNPDGTAGASLQEKYDVPCHQTPLPVGICLTDHLCDILEDLSGRQLPQKHADERGRLVDSYVDAHKHVFGKRAVVYGEPDLVVGLAGLLAEIGIVPALCASGGETGRLRASIAAVAPDVMSDVVVLEGVDFEEIEEHVAELNIDLMVGNSKGYSLSRKLDIPLVRIGFPIHDRVGGPRCLHLGYRGAQQLFDRITNALIEAKQDASSVGYSYM
ncbi:MAG TPA: nitrogenase component 1, partial [Thermoguttaceae bacterium]|nr:nitrogenase component 1 [Thermoguttaceae bacterium]